MSAADRELVEAVARRIAHVREIDPGTPFVQVPGSGLSLHGLRELERFVVDLSKREAARSSVRG